MRRCTRTQYATDQRAGKQSCWRDCRAFNTGVWSIGEFNHSTAMILVGADGAEPARNANIAKADPISLKAGLNATPPGTTYP
jgi:hypothetical protein